MKEGVLKTHLWVHTQACTHLHPLLLMNSFSRGFLLPPRG